MALRRMLFVSGLKHCPKASVPILHQYRRKVCFFSRNRPVVRTHHPFSFSTFTSERQYHEIADLELQNIFDTMCEFEDDHDLEINMSQGVLNIEMDAGSWVLNKQGPNQQIWWSSPVSGPLRFEYHFEKGVWKSSRGGETLGDMVRQEIVSQLRDENETR